MRPPGGEGDPQLAGNKGTRTQSHSHEELHSADHLDELGIDSSWRLQVRAQPGLDNTFFWRCETLSRESSQAHPAY